MNQSEIIKALKTNEKAVCFLDKDFRSRLLQFASTKDLECLQSTSQQGNPRWHLLEYVLNTKDNANIGALILRLRPDYKEEPEVVKKDVYFADGKLYFELIDSKFSEYACDAPRYKDFIGFLYEDGMVYSVPRMYKSTTGKIFASLELKVFEHNQCEVLTPTHVLFKTKQ